MSYFPSHFRLSQKKTSFPAFARLNEKEKIVAGHIFPAYHMAQHMNFNRPLKIDRKINKTMLSSYYQNIMKNNPQCFFSNDLANKFYVILTSSSEYYIERNARFIPMGCAYHYEKKIEFNSFYYRDTKENWIRIFWHELAHLIDSEGLVIHHHFASIAAKSATAIKKLKKEPTSRKRSIIAYFTKPEYTAQIIKHYGNKKFHRLSEEVFAEIFANIMLVITTGFSKKTIKIIERVQKLIQIYGDVINYLLDNIDFKSMGLRITNRKKELIKNFFNQMKTHKKNQPVIIKL